MQADFRVMALTAYVQAGFLMHKEQSAFVYGTSINQLMQKNCPSTKKKAWDALLQS